MLVIMSFGAEKLRGEFHIRCTDKRKTERPELDALIGKPLWLGKL